MEQDHRRVKSRVSPMLGFKSFQHARRVLAGIELIQKLKKGQYGVRSASVGPRARFGVVFSPARCNRTQCSRATIESREETDGQTITIPDAKARGK